ncbi:hypothetical protein [Streptomyces sp. NPDC005302]|uniref:hypothetical protein n=1 Tax=Streptomyces sp. NPDC005302 TaxID=3154675 RepID=UPI0033ACE596
MNTCTATHRKIVRSWGTATEYGHKACGAPATKVRQVKQAHGDYTWPVHFCDEHARPTDEDIVTEELAPVEHRETTVRVASVTRVIRTEVGGKIRTVKQLETAHTKAVRTFIDAARQAELDERYADMVTAAQAPQEDAEGWPGSGERRRRRALADADAWRAKYGKVKSVKVIASAWDAAVKPLTALRTTDPTTYLTEVAPGHYATAEAAEGLFDLPEAPEPEPSPIVRLDGESFLDALLKNVAA